MTPQENKGFELAMQRLQDAEDSVRVAREILSAYMKLGRKSRRFPMHDKGPLDAIKAAVAQEFQIPVIWVEGHMQDKPVVEARQAAYYLCRVLLGASLPALGRAFGRHHTSVLSGLRKVEKLLGSGSDYARRVRQLEVKLKQQCQPIA